MKQKTTRSRLMLAASGFLLSALTSYVEHISIIVIITGVHLRLMSHILNKALCSGIVGMTLK